MQVFDEGGGCRLVWITDVLPHGLAPPLVDVQRGIVAVVKRTLEGAAGG